SCLGNRRQASEQVVFVIENVLSAEESAAVLQRIAGVEMEDGSGPRKAHPLTPFPLRKRGRGEGAWRER
ncbi:MAG TPA: hypothetical protein VIL32_16675, partial [Steroidobacteraceae bacterium]